MNKRLFVAGLPFVTTQDELKTLFGEYGNVISATIIIDRDTGRSKGFGFVEMETVEEAQNATTKLDGSDYGGRKLIVKEANPMEERPRRDNYRGGGGGGGGYNKPRGQSFGGRREGGRGSFGRDRDNSGRGGFRSGRR